MLASLEGNLDKYLLLLAKAAYSGGVDIGVLLMSGVNLQHFPEDILVVVRQILQMSGDANKRLNKVLD